MSVIRIISNAGRSLRKQHGTKCYITSGCSAMPMATVFFITFPSICFLEDKTSTNV
uniref:Uncharacterized protein n=1 Tax=Rhizophora mucronata TaxID=61149 RepID=A0A2P2QRU9_RHIMU